jgi:hypothetical protein
MFSSINTTIVFFEIYFATIINVNEAIFDSNLENEMISAMQSHSQKAITFFVKIELLRYTEN